MRIITLLLATSLLSLQAGVARAWPSRTVEEPGPQEKGEDDEKPPASELEPAQKKRLKKRINTFYYARKRIRCTYCDGKSYLVCSRCRGKGKLYAYYPNTGKVDWDKTKNCPKCRTEGRIDCTLRSCTTGFQEKNLRKIFWEMRSPQYREDLESELGTGDLYVMGFLKAMAIRYKDRNTETSIGFTEIAEELGVDYVKFREFVKERSRYKNLISPFTKFKILETGYESKVRVQELRNGKVVREFFEITEWIYSDGDWRIHSIRQSRF